MITRHVRPRAPYGESRVTNGGLAERLRDEREGILAWAVRGAAAYRERGLERPAAVREVTEACRCEPDGLDEFITTACVTGSGHRVAAGALFEAYEEWAAEAEPGEEERLGPSRFGRVMRERFVRERARDGRHYVGVALRQSVTTAVR